MRGLRKKAALVVAGALLTFQVIAVLGATSASASGTCQYNGATDTVTIVIDDFTGSAVWVDAATDAIWFDGAPCGSATNANTSTIVVLSQSGAGWHDFDIDEDTGDPFSSSISWVIDLTAGSGSFLDVILDGDQDNSFTLTDDSFDLNGAQGEIVSGVISVDVFGGAGDDTIDASATTGNVFGFGGFGGDGADTITGGAGDDYFEGGAGDDVLVGGDGDDDLYGGDDDDSLSGDAGLDELYGEAGDDSLAGGDDDDIVDGGVGGDYIDEGSAINGDDTLEDGGTDGVPAEDDTVDYGARTGCVIIDEDTNVSGEDANCDGDLLDTGDEVDAVLGFEVLISGSGDDILVGNGSDETFVPGDGNDDIDGMGGADTLDYSTSSAGMTVDVAAGTASGQGDDTFANVEDFVGSDFDDTFVDSQTTSESYFGGAGNDWFDQGAADGTDGDLLDGGDDMDTVDYSTRTEDLDVYLDDWCSGGSGECDDFSPATIEDLLMGSGNDYAEGTDAANMIWAGAGDDEFYTYGGSDFLYGEDGVDQLYAGDGNDWLDGGAGDDYMEGGNGVDWVDYAAETGGATIDLSNGFVTAPSGNDDISWGDIENVRGTSFADTILGNGANNTVKGRGGEDNITGGSGDDLLKAGGGDDLVRGGSGDDTMLGAAGDDALYGGGGTDVAKGGKGNDLCKAEIKKSC